MLKKKFNFLKAEIKTLVYNLKTQDRKGSTN